MNKAYDKVVWVNAPSTSSPLNQTNLNKMSDALDTIDDRVIALDSGKVGSVTVTNTLPTGTTLATITVDGTATTIKGSDITVDDEMSTTSANPVQNKVIYAELQNLLPEETVTGNPISISDASGLSAKSCEVAFSPIQSGSGDPSPDNVRPISGWDSLVLTRTGKNLVEITQTGSVTTNGITFTVNADGTITANGTATATAVFLLKRTQDFGKDLQPNTKYIISSGYGNNNIWFGLYYDDSTTWGVTISNDGEKTFTTISDFNYVRFGIRIGSGATVDNVTFKPMVRLSTISDSTFEKYNGQTHTATFPDTVYGGVWKATEGKVYINRLCVNIGSLNWTYQYGSSANPFFKCDDLPYAKFQGQQINSIGYVSVSSMTQNTTDNMAICIYSSTNMRIRNRAYTDVETFKTAMANIQLCYELATPQEITLTAEQIELLKGNNVLFTDGDNITLKYSADIKAWVESQLQS